MRKPFVAGNWKMHGNKAFIKDLMTGLNALSEHAINTTVAICPPYAYIDYAQKCLMTDNISIGAQNMCVEPEKGAFTGEISAMMLKDLGCSYVILGHSERRAIYGETDSQVASKVKVAISAGLTPILCVGETLIEREAGQVAEVIARQLDAVLSGVGITGFATLVIAYEPVWAIGTGKTASAAQAQEVHKFIREKLSKLNDDIANRIIIQYGGSVNPSNAKELFSQPDIDGGLIGGASLKSKDFIAICVAAAGA